VRVPSARPCRAGAAAPGFALATALFALVIIAALAAAAFFAALQEIRLGRNGRMAEVAFEAAEAGLSRALGAGREGGWGALPVGDSSVWSEALPSGGGRFDVAALRLNDQLFLVRSTGADASGTAQRVVGRLVRLGGAGVGLPAALVAGGTVEIGAASTLDGRDTDPPGWGGCPDGGRDTVAGLALPAAADLVAGPECAGLSCLTGEPLLSAAPALRDSVPFGLGGADRTRLARWAGPTYPAGGAGALVNPAPVGTAGSCDRSDPGNWGEPGRPGAVAGCRGYFPVVHASGDLTIPGGRGQGVLIVDGDLTLTGGAEFSGAVLVGGAFRASGAGGRIFGGVVAGGRGGGVAASLEGVSITFSSCALALAAAVSAPVQPIPGRSWAYLY
jgi:hypothetical protein